MFKKLIAGIASITLALGMVALTTTPAAADAPLVGVTGTMLPWSSATNNPDYWEDYGPHDDAECYSHDGNSSHGSITNGGLTVTLNAYGADWPGDHWELLVIKGGSVSNNVIVHPVAGVAYASPLNDSGNQANVSHWIVCKGTTPTPSVTATVPTFTDAVCVAAGQVGQGSYTIPAKTGVRYEVNIHGDGLPAFAQGAGTYPVAVGTEVDIFAYAESGYVLTGNDDWNDTISGPPSSKCVVPAVPAFNGQVCTGPGTKSQASYTIPSSANVQYQRSINDGSWNNISAQTVNVNAFPVKIEIRAVVTSPYIVVPGSVIEWSFNFVSAGDCYGTPQTPNASYTDGFCYSAGTPTGPTVTVFAATGIASFQLSVNGGAFVAFPGTVGSAYTLPVGTTSVQVRPIAAANYLAAADLPVHNFVSPGDCILPATPAASAIEPTCEVEGESQTPVLAPSYVRLYWNAGIASYFIEGYGSVSRPASDPYTDVDTGNPLDELTITPTAFFGYSLTVPDVTVTFAAKIINQCGDGLIGDPTHHDEVCDDGEGVGGWIWVERMEGLQYTITGGTLGSPIVIEGVGTGPYLDGTVALDAGTYTVSTAALPGYVLTPDPDNLPVEITIDEPEESCIVSVELACQLNDGGILLPEIAHLVWTVDVPSDGNPPLYVNTPGPLFIPITIAAVHITASLVGTEYAFPDGLQTGWAFQLEQRQVECGELTTLAPIPTNVTWTQARCVDGKVVGATVTVGNVDGEDWFPEMNYYLDGSDTPLTTRTTAVSAGAHFVDAEPVDPDDSIEEGSLDFWEFNIAVAPGACDLTTLALTGLGSNPFGWAGIGYYLLVTGLALIAVRTVRRRNEVKQ